MNNKILSHAMTYLRTNRGSHHVSGIALAISPYVTATASQVNTLLLQQSKRKSGSNIKSVGGNWYKYDLEKPKSKK